MIVPVLATAALAGVNELPGTLNFRTVTASRIVQSSTEVDNNEKDIDFGDFDEDGDLDVVVATAYSDFGARRNKLYENDGGVLTEVSFGPGSPITGFDVDKVSRNAFFRDFDMDTHLDIWIINDSNSHNDQFFRGHWVDGVFDSFVEENFRIPAGALTGAACSGWSADFDQDGDPDVYCGNYPNSAQDQLQSNNGNGMFTNITATHVPTRLDYVVDVNAADMNGDGKLDLLISNHGAEPNFIYYNDNNDAGSGIGDFQYPDSDQNIGNPPFNENAMSAGDFDNDGDQDIYAANWAGQTDDELLENLALTGGNQAILNPWPVLPPSATTIVSRKPTVVDLNDDGRVDVIVMKEDATNSRPTIVRNVTVVGSGAFQIIDFVDWTPASAFPAGNVHQGWRAKAADTNGDGDVDIFLGGWAGDHLFENIQPVTHLEAALAGGVIPDVYNGEANAVIGTTAPGQQDVYEIQNANGDDGFLSFVVNGPDDYLVEVLDAADAVVMTVDRGGIGVEEAGQYNWGGAPGTVKVRVTGLACGSAHDVAGDCNVDTTDFLALLAAWGPNPGHPADFNGDDIVDTVDFLELLANWNNSVNYVAEVLSRNN